jgi:hypothetical protein
MLDGPPVAREEDARVREARQRIVLGELPVPVSEKPQAVRPAAPRTDPIAA